MQGDGGPRGKGEDAPGWETGAWDTGWTGASEAGDGRPGATATKSGPLVGLAEIASRPMGRGERLRVLFRQRPASAALLSLFLLGFVLTCCAPAIPLLRLGYDAADAAQRISTLQGLFSGGAASLLNGPKLQQAKAETDAITRDLYEINGVMNIAGAPLTGISPQVRNYRLLARIGYDLAASADEGLDVAQTLLLPLEGGALSSNATSPGITTGDIHQARAVLADAGVRLHDAAQAYAQLDTHALPAELQPHGKYGKYLTLLPGAPDMLAEMNVLLDSASGLLGVGRPANYLLIAMDRSELRPGGGFQGNYGILTLDGGKQSKSAPVGLEDTYALDTAYFQRLHGTNDIHDCTGNGNLDQPPLYYWWWPYRLSDNPNANKTCQFNWGLRDVNLAPDFPLNARMAIQIAQESGLVPNTGTIQGVVAFTPELISSLLQPNVLGPITLPAWGNLTVTSENLEHEIHEHQLNSKGPQDAGRKAFTHDLGGALIERLKQAHGDTLKAVLNVVEKSVQTKAVQLYFADPNAELVLRQLGLASEVNTGGQDGFFVVDTNFGGNKANAYVREDQTDYVTLLPNGGALHHTQIVVTYNKAGSVYDGTEAQKDYIDLQRTYLPSDATILGYSGFTPPVLGNYRCGGLMSLITDCGVLHRLTQPSTESDTPGRAMVLGGVMVMCSPGDGTGWNNGIDQTLYDYQFFNRKGQSEDTICLNQPVMRSQTIFLDWYTPHAYTKDASGHGTYTELVQKQPGSVDYLTVYVDASQVGAATPRTGAVSDGALLVTTHEQYAALLVGKKPIWATARLDQDTMVTVTF